VFEVDDPACDLTHIVSFFALDAAVSVGSLLCSMSCVFTAHGFASDLVRLRETSWQAEWNWRLKGPRGWRSQREPLLWKGTGKRSRLKQRLCLAAHLHEVIWVFSERRALQQWKAANIHAMVEAAALVIAACPYSSISSEIALIFRDQADTLPLAAR